MKTIASIIFLILVSISPLCAQQSGGNPAAGEPINLIYADSIVGKENANGTFRFAQGHVQFKQGNVLVWCDKANDYQKENRIELMGSVKIVQGTVTLTSPSANYDGNTKLAVGNQGIKIVDRKTTLTAKTGRYSTEKAIANFYGDVRVEDDSVSIDADTIEYHRSTENSYASGNILMNAKYSHAFIKGDSSVNFPSLNYSRVVGNAVLYQMDTVAVERKDSLTLPKDTTLHAKDPITTQSPKKTTKKPAVISKTQPKVTKTPAKPTKSSRASLKDSLALSKSRSVVKDSLLSSKNDTTVKKKGPDTLTIASSLMEAFRGKHERYVATGKVEMVRGSLAARSDTAYFEKKEERVRLRGAPIIWYDSTQLSADSIIVNIPKQRLKRIEAYSHAFSASRNDTLHYERADQLSGEAIFISVENDTLREVFAKGDAKSLYFLLKEKTPDGVARHSADSIRVTMENGKPEIIRWLGGVNGESFPEKMVDKKTKEYYLPAWHWETLKPKKRSFSPQRNIR